MRIIITILLLIQMMGAEVHMAQIKDDTGSSVRADAPKPAPGLSGQAAAAAWQAAQAEKKKRKTVGQSTGPNVIAPPQGFPNGNGFSPYTPQPTWQEVWKQKSAEFYKNFMDRVAQSENLQTAGTVALGNAAAEPVGNAAKSAWEMYKQAMDAQVAAAHADAEARKFTPMPHYSGQASEGRDYWYNENKDSQVQQAAKPPVVPEQRTTLANLGSFTATFKPKPKFRDRVNTQQFETPVGLGSGYPAGVTSTSSGAAPFTYFQQSPVMAMSPQVQTQSTGTGSSQASSPWASQYKGWGKGGGGRNSSNYGGYVPNWAWNLINWNIG